MNQSSKNLCLSSVYNGLRQGLSQFSGLSRVALIYAEGQAGPLRVYDPQDLLEGHEPKLKELYLDSKIWRDTDQDTEDLRLFGQVYPEKNLGLAGLISYGGRSNAIFYQMWFTTHHPDMCSIGPTERWLEQAASLFSHEWTTEGASPTSLSEHVLREYATHAVRDYLCDQLNLRFGWDNKIWVFPILDAVLGISKTREEGDRPKGRLAFAEPGAHFGNKLTVAFPTPEQPSLGNFKHVRKLLLAVENSDRQIVSDGKAILGIMPSDMAGCVMMADFRRGHGFLSQGEELVCSFADGSFHSSNRKPNLVYLEETLLESRVDPSLGSEMLKIVSSIVEYAFENEYGCAIVIDLDEQPVEISGQKFQHPLNLQEKACTDLACSLAKIDGALHIGLDLKLHAFGCLLDGRAVPGEDRSRGARFNSALRFSAAFENLIVVVVSADRPVSTIKQGVEVTAQCEWEIPTRAGSTPPTLETWLGKKV